MPPPLAREEALRRLAAALAAEEADCDAHTSVEEAAPDTDASSEEADPDRTDDGLASELSSEDLASTQGPPRLTAARLRMISYGLALAAFALLAADLLVGNLGERGADGLPTGEQQSPGVAELSEADVQELREATEERPGDPRAWRALGLALEARGELGDAYNAYSRALELDPDDEEARRLTAWTLIRGYSHEEAIDVSTPLVEDSPDDPENLLLLGLAQYGADHPDADRTLVRYLGIAPDGPAADRVRAMLEE